MLKTQEGGKTRPYTTSFRPNHNFGQADGIETFIGQVEVPDGTRLDPGETYDLIVRFLEVPRLSGLLQVGRAWRIQEGQRLVARAQVLQRLGAA
jgi:translation elongation factor EF-Tu-like GTPase